ncbi:hypothetical protein ACOKM3_23715 [Streptomyces sp. BH106]|jgi:hypothetical protein|uniref:hypothetical protein n=1 Tax=Streptomyces sp. BH106 TaxID=3410409 RepID=UPI003CEF6C0D
MMRTKKALVLVAMVIGVAAGAATPAMADSHISETPQDSHISVTPQDSHISVSPQDSHIS